MHQNLTTQTLIICTLLIVTTTSAFAVDSTRVWHRPNLVKTNLFAPISLFYERALTQRFALQGSIRWFSYTTRQNQSFVNAAIEGRFYIGNVEQLRAKDHPAGFYVSPYLKARSLNYINEIGYGTNKVGDLDEVIIKSIGLGVTIGHQWVGRKGFTGDIFLGGGAMPPALSTYHHTMRYSNVISTNGFDYLTLDLRAGISLGYAF